METKNNVWVVTGEDWDHERGTRVVIGVCPTEKDAENLKFRVEDEYDNIWTEEFCPKTYSEPPVFYDGGFRAEIRPKTYSEPPAFYDGGFRAEIRPFFREHYILHNIEFMGQIRKILPDGHEPNEKFEFSVEHIIKSNGSERYIITGNFISVEKVPTEGDEAKRWLIQKINEKGLIILEHPI